jgi:maleylpyruvate isomerase
MNRPVLHNFFRSSTSHRVRIALKGVAYDYEAYHLRKGEQRQLRYLAMNPQGLVPTFVAPNGVTLTQSLAIIEYLDEVLPEPELLPGDPLARARVRSLAQMIALDVHPINNLRVLGYLREQFGADDVAIERWFRHWVREAFVALEKRLATEKQSGRYCHGDTVTLADICLAAQLTSNRRFAVPIDEYPTIARIGAALAALPAFIPRLPRASLIASN